METEHLTSYLTLLLRPQWLVHICKEMFKEQEMRPLPRNTHTAEALELNADRQRMGISNKTVHKRGTKG